MTGKPYPSKFNEHLRSLLAAWKEIDPELAISGLTQPGMHAGIEQLEQIIKEIGEQRLKMVNLCYQRDELALDLWDQSKRVRNGIKSLYGDDSQEYKLIGGTRKSERKRPSRKPKPPTE